MTTTAQLLNFVNLVLCFAYGLSAMCRLARMHDRVVLRVALVYLALFVGSVVSGLQFFFFGTFAGWPDVAASAVLCGLLWMTMHEWREGPPPSSCLGA
jgi:hypothetical protein